jgi:hypothetical protein
MSNDAGQAHDRDRGRYVSASSMLGVCTAPGCGTVVFGQGTCVDHDPPGLHLVDILLDEAVGRGEAVSGH